MNIVTDRNIVKHLACAFGCAAIDLPLCDVIEKVIFISVAAEALRARPNSATILPITIPPRHVKSVLSGLSHVVFEFLKLLLTHHFPSIGISNNTKMNV
jgi:hypothetical protein